MSEPHKLKAVEQYGNRYIREYLSGALERHEAITSDPLEALAFMYGKMFMRGRRDEVSVIFRDRTLEVLRSYKRLPDIDPGTLDTSLREARVNNRYDRQMVKESINFVSNELQNYGCNVFNWAVDAIQNGSAAEAYGALTNIFAIRDKLATFYLRDVALLEDIEESISSEHYVYFQPVDTWVAQVAARLSIVDEDDRRKLSTVKSRIINECLAADVSPLLFNAGAWMVGAHASRLLIERL